MDRRWEKLVDSFLGNSGARGEERSSRDTGGLRASDYYKLAYTQWTCGASDRVVTMLLRAALRDAVSGKQ